MMTPEQTRLLEAFESCELESRAFRHRDHLTIAWLYLRRDGAERGAEQIVAGIKRFAAAKGVPEKYHHTETLFWIRVMTHVVETFSGVDDFDAIVSRVPQILDKYLPLRHFDRDTIMSPAARAAWVEADRLPLPF